MNPPEWPGQPPGRPGFPPPVAPAAPPPAPPVGAPLYGPPLPGPPLHGPPLPGGPGFPPPHRGGSGPLVPLLIIGVVLFVIIGVGAFVVLRGDTGKGGTVSLPTYTRSPFTAPSVEPSPPTTTGVRTSDPAGLLSPAVETAKGNTFTRAGTRTESCATRANTPLLTALRSYPCMGLMHSAVYTSPSKQIMTVISILKFGSPSAASSISDVTNQSGWPKLLTPSDASGLPQPRPNPAYWTRTWTRGSNVIYAQSYWSSGGPTGGRTGSVFATAGELGVEITNAILFTS